MKLLRKLFVEFQQFWFVPTCKIENVQKDMNVDNNSNRKTVDDSKDFTPAPQLAIMKLKIYYENFFTFDKNSSTFLIS